MAIDVKQAVQRAFEHARELYKPQDLQDLRLEAVEYDELHKEWKITVGFDTGKTIKKKSGMNLFPETSYETQRAYKEFYIDEKTGAMKKMLMA